MKHSLVMAAAFPYAIFNLAGDKVAARAEWKARFENRGPPTQPRAAKTVVIKAAADASDTTDILLYDEIGYWGVTAKEFVAALASVTTTNVRVRINSPGGDVFDGLAIYNALKTRAGKVTCVVDGLAASAASFIALAGETVSIHESAMMMIHRAWGYALGNQGDMAEMAKILGKIDGQLADIYAGQTGKKAADMLQLMTGDTDGTWFTADEAAAIGMVDEVIKPDQKTDTNKTADPEAASEGIDGEGAPCSCDESDPDYDPDCDCSAENCAKAKVLKAAEAQKTGAFLAAQRRRLALAEAE